jgi:hypothetical protein
MLGTTVNKKLKSLHNYTLIHIVVQSHINFFGAIILLHIASFFMR